MKITKDQLDRLAAIHDKADNYWHAAGLPLSDEIHRKNLRTGMFEIVSELRALYREVGGGDDPWVL